MYKHLPSPVNFREDINGLRAWAVIAVLLFHFSLIGLPGGFVGVDIFFVISGYLMTAIVVSKLEKGSFSLLDFYMARVRRILPALLVVVASLLAIGWFLLPTPDYQELGKHSAYSLAFLSNITYWLTTGYFDSDAHDKWLLHTWSLAVEAQFYLIYPIIVLIIWRIWSSIKVVIFVLVFLFIFSFTFNLMMAGFNESFAFYLLPTRGWELASGGIVYLLARQITVTENKTIYLQWLGWILILYSFVFINGELAWPGYAALVPVLGTSLIIFSNQQACRLTNNFLAQWLGDRSYSLYLWHWPLVVALHYASLANDWIWVSLAFTLSILLAHLSYQFIETPTRKYLSQKSLKKEIIVISFFILVIGLSAVIIKKTAFNGRVSSNIEIAANAALDKNPRRDACHENATANGSPSCKYGDINGPLSAVIIGDSHANAVIGGLAEVAKSKSKSVMEWTMSACPPILGAKYTKIKPEFETDRCKNFNEWSLQESKKIPKDVPIIMVGRSIETTTYKPPPQNQQTNVSPKKLRSIYFDDGHELLTDKEYEKGYSERIVMTACKWAETHPVFLMRPIPIMDVNVPKTLSRNLFFSNDSEDIRITLNEYKQRHKAAWLAQEKAAKMCKVKILNPLPYLCDNQFCYGSKNGRPLYYDDDHLSEHGNRLLIPMFEEVFKKATKL